MTCTVAQAGIDTWSPAWYVDPSSMAADMLDQLATVKAKRGDLLPDAVGEHRVGWIKPLGLLYAEGHPMPDRLCPPDALPRALSRLVRSLEDAGVPVPPGNTGADFYGADINHPGFAGVRRLDATVDLAFPTGAEGLAALAGVAAVARGLTAGKADVIFGQKGEVQTVYLLGHGEGRRVLGRWYDKGVEGGTAPRGQLVRPEDQRRFVKATRRDVTELDATYVRGKFHQRFMPLYRASKGVTVGGPIVMAEKLVEAVEAGELTMPQAEKVAGHLLLQASARARDRGVSRRTVYRRQAVVRELGLVLADGVLQEVEVDLHDVLERAMDEPAWGAQG